MNTFLSELDCQRFGYKVAKISTWESLDIEETIIKCRQEGIKLIISKVNSEELKIINKLENFGFRIKDSQVTYRFDIKALNFDGLSLSPNFIIREVVEGDLEKLVLISQESFIGYGHYYSDDRLDKNRCAEIYPDWARRSCLDRTYADKVFVAEINGQVAGFLSFKLYKNKGEVYAAGGMGSVSKDFRKLGIFSLLVKRGLLWGAEIGLAWEEHNVLTTNYAVNRVFSNIGFVVVNSFMTLHGWVD